MKKIKRKEFLKKAAIAGAGIFSIPVVVKESHGKETKKTAIPKVIKRSNKCLLERMERELYNALEKPLNKRHWVMVIDLKKCTGCNACTIACKSENKLPLGVIYRIVIEEEIGRYPNVSKRFTPRPCMHCDIPLCVPVCPVGATKKREDGIVTIDYERCMGCRYCMVACPYNARTFDFGEFYTKDKGFFGIMEYENIPTYEYNQNWERQKGKSPVGNARKCHYCLHRIERGLLPACVTTCMGRATYFGDVNDDNSLVAELVSSPNVMRLKEEVGTNPQVFYLM